LDLILFSSSSSFDVIWMSFNVDSVFYSILETLWVVAGTGEENNGKYEFDFLSWNSGNWNVSVG
jgi:hypothetical protein